MFREIRGDGLLLGCELEAEFEGRGKEIVKAAEEAGLLLLIAGPNVMRLAPSLLITPDDIREGMQRFDAALLTFTNTVRAATAAKAA